MLRKILFEALKIKFLLNSLPSTTNLIGSSSNELKICKSKITSYQLYLVEHVLRILMLSYQIFGAMMAVN